MLSLRNQASRLLDDALKWGSCQKSGPEAELVTRKFMSTAGLQWSLGCLTGYATRLAGRVNRPALKPANSSSSPVAQCSCPPLWLLLCCLVSAALHTALPRSCPCLRSPLAYYPSCCWSFQFWPSALISDSCLTLSSGSQCLTSGLTLDSGFWLLPPALTLGPNFRWFLMSTPTSRPDRPHSGSLTGQKPSRTFGFSCF